MKFIVSSTALYKHLQAISGALGSNSSLAILNNFLFKTEGKTLHLTASDLETTMTTKVELDMVDKNFAVAVPSKQLLELFKSLPEQPLSFTIDESTFLVEVQTDYGRYKFAGRDGMEYPKYPQLENPTKIAMDSAALYTAIDYTLFATANDTVRPVLSGVNLLFGSDQTVAVGTDAHKLVKYSRTDVVSSESASIILPKKALTQLKNLCADAEGAVQISFTPSNALFEVNEATLVCRLIEGKYPNFEAVIPKDNPNVLFIERDLLMNTLRRVAIFASKSNPMVGLKIAGSELQITSEDTEISNEGTERLTCNYSGEDMEIGFNCKFLLEMISNMKCKELRLEMSVPNRPGILRPNDPDMDANEDLLMLVMPVMLNR